MRSFSIGVSLIALTAGVPPLSSVPPNPTPSPGPTPTPAPAFTTLNEDGFSTVGPVAMPGNASLQVTRQGFDATGTPRTFTETVYSYGAYFQVAPTLASSATASTLSDTLWATDSIPGVFNKNPDSAPKGVLRWQQADRRVVKDRVKGSLVGYHIAARNRKPFACIRLLISDGTNTITTLLTEMTVDTTQPTRDRTKVWEYNYDVDVSSLANGPITVNAEGYPWVGDANSVLKSISGTPNSKGFCPQAFLKNTASNNGIVNYVYLDASGSDSTAYVGPDYALAKASPAATPLGAWNRAFAVVGLSGMDGLGVFCGAGTWEVSGSPTNRALNYEASVQRDPLVPKASVVWQFGTGNTGPTCNYLKIRDITLKRGGAYQLKNARVCLQDVDYDNNSQTLCLIASPAALLSEGGVFVSNATYQTFQPTGGAAIWQLRGTLASGPTIGSQFVAEADNVVGCELNSFIMQQIGGRAAGYYDGLVVYSNKFMKCGGATDIFTVGVDLSGGFVANNVWEWCKGTGPALGFSRDSGTASLRDFHFVHNVLAAAQNAGRLNHEYDETQATQRTHKYCSFHNNILGQLNHKNGWFLWVTSSQTFSDGRTGGLEFFFGVNCTGTFTMFADAGPNSPWFRQCYPGRASSIGSSSTAINDPKFVNNQAITYDGSKFVEGLGGGDYSLQSTSPCKNAGVRAVLPGGINGVAFDTSTPNLGAFG